MTSLSVFLDPFTVFWANNEDQQGNMNDTKLGKARTTRRSSRRCLFHRIWSHVFAESGERCPRPFQMLRTSSRAFTCAEECALSKVDAEYQTATELKANRSRCRPS